MPDLFQNRAASASGSAFALRAVTPDDARDLPDGLARGLFVARGGAIALHDAGGVAVAIVSADAQYHPVQVRRILAAGTTATGLVALY